MSEFRMPALGADMEAGTLVEWLKQPGDVIKRGDIIAVVDTQKGAIEIEVFEDGVLEQTVVAPGDKVPVGTVLALIRGQGAESAATQVAAAAAPSSVPIAPAESPAPKRRGRPHVTPLARRLAGDLGVDIDVVKGTGPDGAITSDDIQRAAAQRPTVAVPPPAPPPAPAPAPRKTPAKGPVDRTAAMRQAIASAMARSKREIPHYYLSTTIDMTVALTWLRAENEKRTMPDRLLPAVLLLKAVALALSEIPDLNGHWVDGRFQAGAGIHVGCAISLRGGGLVAPALHGADTLELSTLMRRLQDLVTRARAGLLKSSELTDPTITVTNLGDQGVESTFGIIYPPQVALVGFGRISERPWIGAQGIEARPLLTATLSADHRASDGHRGGLFLSAIDRLLRTPEKL